MKNMKNRLLRSICFVLCFLFAFSLPVHAQTDEEAAASLKMQMHTYEFFLQVKDQKTLSVSLGFKKPENYDKMVREAIVGFEWTGSRRDAIKTVNTYWNRYYLSQLEPYIAEQLYVCMFTNGADVVVKPEDIIKIAAYDFVRYIALNDMVHYVDETQGADGVESFLGDVSMDGQITAQDARLALRISVDLEPDITPDTYRYIMADVNTDGAVTAEDARTLLRISVNLQP